MKKQYYLATMLGLFVLGLTAQDNPNKAKSASFTSEQEKAAAIKKLESKIKIDVTDPSFPKEDLDKEKKELASMKEAKVVTAKSNK